MKNTKTFSILLIIIWSCNHSDNIAENLPIESIDTLSTLTGTNWNIVVNLTDSSLYEYNNQPLYFSDNYAYFFDQRIAELAVNGDSIFLRDTSYISSLNPEWDNKMKVKTYLIGRIEKITQDSLKIEKIKGWGRPFYNNERFVFYNDTLSYDSNLKLNRIVFSTSTCYGECPAMAIEISADSSFKFYGGEYSEFKGNFIGSISYEYKQKLQNELRMANINTQPSHFPEPVDAPVCELIIYYNDSLRKEILGYYGALPPRVKNIALLMYDSYKSAKMDSTGKEIIFETRAHKPPPPPTLDEK